MPKVLVILLSLFLLACERSVDETAGSDSGQPNDVRVCGGIAGIGCGEDEYCQFEKGQCHIADGQGICQPKTEFCTKDYRPVCGCDGKTYGNECTAASFGVSVQYDGECTKEP